MNAEQVIEGVARAVAVNLPLEEYCFLNINFDPVCTNITMWQLIISTMGTIGTVAAVVAALWISYKSDRQKSKMEASIKIINVVNVIPVLEGLAKELDEATNYALFTTDASLIINELRSKVSESKLWAEEYANRTELAALSPNSILLLPERAGLQISHAMGILRAVQIDILRFVPETHDAIDFKSRTKLSEWTSDKKRANNCIKSAIRYLRSESDLNSFYPSYEETYGKE